MSGNMVPSGRKKGLLREAMAPTQFVQERYQTLRQVRLYFNGMFWDFLLAAKFRTTAPVLDKVILDEEVKMNVLIPD